LNRRGEPPGLEDAPNRKPCRGNGHKPENQFWFYRKKRLDEVPPDSRQNLR
jgi:hypothetical protein